MTPLSKEQRHHHVISNTRAFPAIIRQTICCEKGALEQICNHSDHILKESRCINTTQTPLYFSGNKIIQNISQTQTQVIHHKQTSRFLSN